MVKKQLGEIALRTRRLNEMQDFYQNVVGLEPMDLTGDIRFFKVAEGYAGHTQSLALFGDHVAPNSQKEEFKGMDPKQSSLHHIAFSVDAEDFERERQRVAQLGYQVTTADHAWVQWRSFYINDPDGNTVEWVCFNVSIPKATG